MSEPPLLLCASDLDGTLLNVNHETTEVTKDVLYRIETERNVPFILATGRHHLSVRSVRDDLVRYFAERRRREGGDDGGDGKPPGFFLVSSNGARIHDASGVLAVEHNLDPAIVKDLYMIFGLPYTRKRYTGPPGTQSPPLPNSPVTVNEAGEVARVGGAHQPGSAAFGVVDTNNDEDNIHQNDEEPMDVVSTSAYTTDDWHITASFLSDEDMFKKFGIVPTCTPFDSHAEANKGKSIFDSFPLEGVGKVCFRCSNKSILDYFEKAIKERFGERVSVALSSNYCLDVMAGGISKASALRELADIINARNEKLGNGKPPITMDKMIGFGDSMNDKAFLEAVGKGCVMQNAQPRLKKALPQCEVIGNHDANAVAVKLMEVFSL